MDADVDSIRAFQALKTQVGQLYDQVWATYVPLQTALVETGGGLAGGVLNIGTYTVGPVGSGATYTFAYRTTAKALNVFIAAKWAAVADASVAYLIPNGGAATDQLPQVRSHVAASWNDGNGIWNLDANALGQIVIANANTTGFVLRVMGYFV